MSRVWKAPSVRIGRPLWVSVVVGLLVAILTPVAVAADLVLEVQRGSSLQGPWTRLAEVKVPDVQAPEYFRLQVASPSNAPVLAGYVWVPAGAYTMGTPDSEAQRRTAEGPQTTVKVADGFWMSRMETTLKEWSAIMEVDPASILDPELPVESVSWEEAVDYCARLTKRERAEGRLPKGYVVRLPTEAEWEYACRAGSTSAFSFGDSLASTNANFDGTRPYGGAAPGAAPGQVLRGGQYPPNAWGLFDMHGNVWEWCMDWHPSRLPGGKVTDPVGSGSARQRALRGGAWHNEAALCRSGYRYLIGPIFRASSSGLRPVVAKEL